MCVLLRLSIGRLIHYETNVSNDVQFGAYPKESAHLLKKEI